VFLHPQTHEEYALARTERKTGPGYTGFETCTDPDITLEQDLRRRDLTINAMAETPEGELIDPYNGLEDLDNGVLRHISPAFAEDPVRILRTARFAARFAHWGFHVAHGTNALMRRMVADGEADHLVPERVWAELVKALQTDTPARFFQVLAGCGALAAVFPELADCVAHDAEAAHDRLTVQLPVLEGVVGQSEAVEIRFAALVCDLDNLHPERLSADALLRLCERYRVPNASRDLARLALLYRSELQQAGELSATELLALFGDTDALRRGDRFNDLLVVCAADAAVQQRDCDSAWLQRALQAVRNVSAAPLLDHGLDGKALGEALQARRIEALQQLE
jgi:tRNA nucleotidyltransferase (CCA-adding enzyme)